MSIFFRNILVVSSLILFLGVGCVTESTEETSTATEEIIDEKIEESYEVENHSFTIGGTITFSLDVASNYRILVEDDRVTISSPDEGNTTTEKITVSIVDEPPIELSFYETCNPDNEFLSCVVTEDGWYISGGQLGPDAFYDYFYQLENGQYFSIEELYDLDGPGEEIYRYYRYDNIDVADQIGASLN